jgi:hypothetical protein
MTNGTEDGVALLAALEHGLRDRLWKRVDIIRDSLPGSFFPRKALLIGAQVAAGDRARH